MYSVTVCKSIGDGIIDIQNLSGDPSLEEFITKQWLDNGYHKCGDGQSLYSGHCSPTGTGYTCTTAKGPVKPDTTIVQHPASPLLMQLLLGVFLIWIIAVIFQIVKR